MNDLQQEDEFQPEDSSMVYQMLFKNHSHVSGNYPLVIVKSVENINNNKENKNKWFCLFAYVTNYLYNNYLLINPAGLWNIIYELESAPTKEDTNYMFEFMYDHMFHIIAYTHHDTVINCHFTLFVDNKVSRLHLTKYSKDLDSWGPILTLDKIEHGQR